MNLKSIFCLLLAAQNSLILQHHLSLGMGVSCIITCVIKANDATYPQKKSPVQKR